MWQATRDEGASKRIMRPQPGGVQVVVADVERVPAARHGYRVAAGRPIDLIFILEPRRREVANWSSRPGSGHRGKGPRRVIGNIGLDRRIEWTLGVAPLLAAAFRTSRLLGVFCLDVAFALKLWDELLDDFDLEVIQQICGRLLLAWLHCVRNGGSRGSSREPPYRILLVLKQTRCAASRPNRSGLLARWSWLCAQGEPPS